MFKQIQKLVAGTLSVLALAVVAAPAHAGVVASGRAGQVQNLQFKGLSAPIAQTIVKEFVGLVHVISVDEGTGRFTWTLLARDGRQVIASAEATQNEAGDAFLSGGVILKGAFAGTQISVVGYRRGEAFLLDAKLSLGNMSLAFTQELEPIEESEE